MEYTLPHTIESGHGEKIVFKAIVHEPDGDKVMTEGFCIPKAGPPMHVHFKQDEGFTVVSGKIGYQKSGEEPIFLLPGQSVIFHRNQPHRFWNAGNEELHIEGWLKPANNTIFFLTALYAAQRAGSNGRPELFDAAYLMTRYKSEFSLLGLPVFVKKMMIPIVYRIGKMTGKYKKFKDAPSPL